MDWIPHLGFNQPVPDDAIVETRNQRDETVRGEAGELGTWVWAEDSYPDLDDPHTWNIVAYRFIAMTPVEEINEMIRLVAVAHKGQVDKAEVPYLLHPLAVAQNLRTNDYQLMAIAVGHDLFEDTTVNAQYLRWLGFSERVINGISNVTKGKDGNSAAYRNKVASTSDSLRVKIKDMEHNMDLSRLPGEPTEKDIARNVVYADNIVWYRTRLAVLNGEMEDPDA